ncbi:methyl-CpG-binding protein [Cryobacterium sp. TMT1-2-1]|nr:methyl-CpG-binding protein [Cryobacterium sp. TMT1-2-1]
MSGRAAWDGQAAEGQRGPRRRARGRGRVRGRGRGRCRARARGREEVRARGPRGSGGRSRVPRWWG